MDPVAIIAHYYTPDTPLYNILVTHSRAVADRALEIVSRHPEWSVDREFVEQAALLHDIGIFLTDAPEIHCTGKQQYIEHGYLGANLLRAEGLLAHALVCERHTGAGISLQHIIDHNLPLPRRDMLPVSLEEQIICFADKFHSKTHLHTPLTLPVAREKIARFGTASLERFDCWIEKFDR
ncbi:MAG: HD domain-containing protein [Prevotellaceae bacterium]|jgi:uncharacterized protein|nr:HD domain-containing protein [Prevotellaceae bacterium]